MTEKLSPEGEAVAAYAAATVTAFQLLVIALQQNGALDRGQMPDLIEKYIERSKGRVDDLTLRALEDFRTGLTE